MRGRIYYFEKLLSSRNHATRHILRQQTKPSQIIKTKIIFESNHDIGTCRRPCPIQVRPRHSRRCQNCAVEIPIPNRLQACSAIPLVSQRRFQLKIRRRLRHDYSFGTSPECRRCRRPLRPGDAAACSAPSTTRTPQPPSANTTVCDDSAGAPIAETADTCIGRQLVGTTWEYVMESVARPAGATTKTPSLPICEAALLPRGRHRQATLEGYLL